MRARPLRVLSVTTEKTADYSYGSDPSQMLTATWDATAPAPTAWVVLVHGGSWSLNPGRAYMGTARGAFRRAGFAVFSVDYRPRPDVPGGAPWPAMRLDIANAIIWVKSHAKQFRIDPHRGGIYGFSAGSQLVALMGTVGAGSARVRAVIGVSGPYDPFQLVRAAQGQMPGVEPTPIMKNAAVAAERLAGCPAFPTTSACWPVWKTLYAGTYATADDAPHLLFHGDADPGVPYQLSQQYHSKLVHAGAESTLVLVPGGGHGQRIVFEDPGRTAQALAFMTAHTVGA